MLRTGSGNLPGDVLMVNGNSAVVMCAYVCMHGVRIVTGVWCVYVRCAVRFMVGLHTRKLHTLPKMKAEQVRII